MPAPDAIPSPCRVRRAGRIYWAERAERDIGIEAPDGPARFAIPAGNWVVVLPERRDDGAWVICGVYRSSEFFLTHEVIPEGETHAEN